MNISVAQIFNEQPQQWGLRGDPCLWKDMEDYFTDRHVPLSTKEFQGLFYHAFQLLTGKDIRAMENIYVAKYNQGGMSGGWISSKFWMNAALPILTERLEQMNEE